MNDLLIYDIGAHLGEDTEFYLKKGFRVLAIEANPALVEKLKTRFQPELTLGNLVLIDTAISESEGEATFYVNDNSVWGTIRSAWAERNSALGSSSKPITVKTISFPKVLERYGVPYYLKIDIEGADLLCLEGLSGRQDKPQFVSIESEKRSWKALIHEFEIFKRLGYSRFKIVDQESVAHQTPPNPAKEGRYTEYRFERGSSGLFGEELPGKWLTVRQAIRKYRFVFLRYYLFGDFGILRPLLRIPILRRRLTAPWYDTHAAL